jgi:hypothetical protein
MSSLSTRRRFLQFGGVGLMNAGLLRTVAAEKRRAAKARACIIVFQVGGPYQCETFDPKPNAPEEVRGLFKPLRTRVPGMQLTEGVPMIARQADKLAIIRSLHHTIRCHNPAIYCSLVGRELNEPLAVSSQTNAKRSDHPHYASVLAKLRPGKGAMPDHVIIPDVTNNGPARTPGLNAGYLGTAYDPFVLGANPAAGNFRVETLGLPNDIDSGRMEGRASLLQQLDGQQRLLEKGGGIEAMDTLKQRAFGLLTTTRAKEAFDLSKEAPKVHDRYGNTLLGQGSLLARRLVEAGVPFVTVFSHTVVEARSWDTHTGHDALVKDTLLPPADQSFGALVEDLSNRGLLDEVLVVWMGEFGRTPRRGVMFSNAGNDRTGRDHWCNCYAVALAGGGVKGGNIVGSSDWIGAYPKERPVHISDLAATIFAGLGVDPRSSVVDLQGQPHQICDGSPVTELF